MYRQLIMVVDDDQGVRDLLQTALEVEGWRTVAAKTGTEAIASLYQKRPDLVLLDINLPDSDGFQVCRDITSHFATPIIILSARSDTADKVRCLEMGADDYVTKPFDFSELTARIKAVLRRRDLHRLAASGTRFKNAELELDFDAGRFIVRGGEISFTTTEHHLLQVMVLNADQVLSHRVLLESVWGSDYENEHEYLHEYVRRLRAKIEVDPHNPCYLVTEPGIGYVFRGPQS